MITTSSVDPTTQFVEKRRLRLERLLQIVARDFELRLEFGNRDLLGDGEIVMEADPEDVAAASYRALKGQALHLLGHYLSEGRTWADAVRRKEAEGWPHLRALWHALEDARVENWMVRQWPGTDKAFDAKLPPNLGGSLLRLMSPTHQIELGLYLWGRGYREAAFGSRVRGALDAVGDVIDEAANSGTPKATLEAIETIYPAVAELLRATTPLRREPRPLETEQGEADARRTWQHADDAESEETPRDGPPELEISDETVSVGASGRRREFPEWFRPGTAPWFERGLGEKDVHPAAVCTDRQTVVKPEQGDRDAYRAMWSEVQQEAGYLVHRMTNLLRDEVDLRYGGRFRTGKLNMAKLWKQRMGYYRLFQRRVSGGRPRAAFTLLVDESASMERQSEPLDAPAAGAASASIPVGPQEKIRVATKAAVLLGETLDQLGVPLEIIGYSTADFEARAAMQLGLTPAHEYRTTRCSLLEHRLYKRFDEPYRIVRTRLTNIQPRHNNWDEEHLLFAFRRIQARSEPTKVIIVISDGQPNGDADELIATVSGLESLGCKIVGVGIGADFVREIYPNAIVVSTFRQMAEELLEILVSELGSSKPLSVPTAVDVAT